MELRRLVREMALSNLSWGEERIANELLLKLGIRISPRRLRLLSLRSDVRQVSILKHLRCEDTG